MWTCGTAVGGGIGLVCPCRAGQGEGDALGTVVTLPRNQAVFLFQLKSTEGVDEILWGRGREAGQTWGQGKASGLTEE